MEETVEVRKPRFWTWTKIKLAFFAVVCVVTLYTVKMEELETLRYKAAPEPGDIVFYIHDKQSETPIAVLKIIKVMKEELLYVPCKYQYNKVTFAHNSLKKVNYHNKSFDSNSVEQITIEAFEELDIDSIIRP